MTNKHAAIKIIRKLKSEGFQALLAGGCVRDMLMGRAAKDYDVATDARPGQVRKLFLRTLEVGAKFGVVIVLMKDKQVEVATFRAEKDYHDGRHPDKVTFTGPGEDAKRRDFTINGMFYDPVEEKVIDYVGGQADLKKRIIRTIGEPGQRFAEDYLRMLRAVRFSTQLGFPIGRSTKAAICSLAVKIKQISGERISAELEGILTHPNRAKGASLLFETGLAQAIFGHFAKEQADAAVNVLGKLRKRIDFPLSLAAFFSNCKTEFALENCRSVKLSRNQLRHIKFLLTNRDRLLDEKISLARLKLILSEPYFWDLYELQRAIQKTRDDRKALTPLIKLRRRIKALGDVELRPPPILNGHDLIGLGAASGPSLGQLSEEMYIAQLEGEIQTPEEAEKWVQNWLRKHKNSAK